MRHKKLKENLSDEPRGEISRREWLMKLGEAAFVLGFSGSTAEQQANATTALRAAAAELQALPAGLYEPSSEHMAHALMNDQRYIKIPAGSSTDYVRPREGPFRPAFFRAREFQAVQVLVRATLGAQPKTTVEADAAILDQTIAEIAQWVDLAVSQAALVREAAHQISPQHRALAIAYYGKGAIEKLETGNPGKVCRDGLKWLDDRSEELHGARFVELNELAQIEVARSTGDANPPAGHGNAGLKFLSYLSSQTVLGWYTSRLGLTELGYRGNSFSVKCPGCAPS